MTNVPEQDRVMIPIAVLTKTPETMSEIQALQINMSFDPIVVDPAGLKNSSRSASVAALRSQFFG
jgi:hypothetical protein